MPRPNEIAADARALYGPPAVRPAAGAMGDGALWVDPGNNQALYQVQSGNWVRIALPDVDDDSSPPAGVPVLRGPYIVDYTDIPHDGDAKTLWTPAVGDVLLRLFPDWQTLVQWDHGNLYVGQLVDGTISPAHNLIAVGWQGDTARGLDGNLDTILDGAIGWPKDASGGSVYATAHVLHTASPVQIQLAQTGGPDPSTGHLDLYALVARAVAP